MRISLFAALASALAAAIAPALAVRLAPHLEALFDGVAPASAAAGACVNSSTIVAARDGTHLMTYLYLPPEAANGTAQVPVVFLRTPYGAKGEMDGRAPGLCSRGYAAVSQDFRGRFGSNGNFSFWRYGASDAEDTIEWLVKQPWCTGAVGEMGASANGIAQYVQPVRTRPAPAHPALQTQFVVVGTGQLHRTAFQQGAFRQALIAGWLNEIGEANYTATVLAHEGDPSFADPYWAPIDFTNSLSNVTWPAVHVTGHYDIFNRHTLDAYHGYSTQAGTALARTGQYLVVLPGGHCKGGAIAWTNVSWGLAAGAGLAAQMQDATLQPQPARSAGQPGLRRGLPPLLLPNGQPSPKIVWYVLGPGLPGTTGLYWTGADAFPKATPWRWHMLNNGSLSLAPPPASVAPAQFAYDPRDPVPTVGGNNLLLPKCGPQDQAGVESRPDVAVFTSPALTQTVALTGDMTAALWVSSNVTDTDFVVKLTDVFPGGAVSMLVQDAIIRMRWRDANGRPGPQSAPMTPGAIYNVTVDLGHTSYIFNAGHRVRVTVSSSNFPRFSANPNTGKPVADPSQMPQPAQQTLWTDAARASHVELPMVPLSALAPL